MPSGDGEGGSPTTRAGPPLLGRWAVGVQTGGSLAEVMKKGAEKVDCSLEYYKPATIDGVEVAIVGDEVLQRVQKKGGGTVVLKTVGKLYQQQIASLIKRQWKISGGFNVQPRRNGVFHVHFKDAADCRNALSMGDQFMLGVFTLVRPWSQAKALESLAPRLVPIWVTFPEFPNHLWDKETFGRVGSLLGKPIRMDSSTSRGEGVDAKVLVTMNALKPFPTKVRVATKAASGEDMVEVSVAYLNPPPKCDLCHCFGHWTKDCKGKKSSNPPAQATKRGAGDIPAGRRVASSSDEPLEGAGDKELTGVGGCPQQNTSCGSLERGDNCCLEKGPAIDASGGTNLGAQASTSTEVQPCGKAAHKHKGTGSLLTEGGAATGPDKGAAGAEPPNESEERRTIQPSLTMAGTGRTENGAGRRQAKGTSVVSDHAQPGGTSSTDEGTGLEPLQTRITKGKATKETTTHAAEDAARFVGNFRTEDGAGQRHAKVSSDAPDHAQQGGTSSTEEGTCLESLQTRVPKGKATKETDTHDAQDGRLPDASTSGKTEEKKERRRKKKTKKSVVDYSDEEGEILASYRKAKTRGEAQDKRGTHLAAEAASLL